MRNNNAAQTAENEARKISKLDMLRFVPLLLLLFILLVTYLLWRSAYRASVQELQAEFNSRVSDIRERVQRRVNYYEQVLRGVRSFYLNQRETEPKEFIGYLDLIELDRNLPGIQGVSFAPLVPDAGKTAHVQLMRGYGLAGYDIRPDGKRPFYAPVAYIAPSNERNLRVLGFDNMSSPARRASIEQARDQGQAVISEKLVLKQEDRESQQAGFLIFLPVFHRGTAYDTPAARRENIAGWLAASFRMNDLIVKALDDRANGINVEIFDNGEATEQARMYGVENAGSGRAMPFYATTAEMEVLGRKWLFRFSSLPEFEGKRDVGSGRYIAIAGSMLSILLSLIAWLLVRDSRRAINAARIIQHELIMRKQAEDNSRDLHLLNESILDKSPAGIAVFRATGECVMANESYAKAIGGTINDVMQLNFRSNPSWKHNGLLGFADQALKTGGTIRRDIEGETYFGQKVALECIFSLINIAGKPHLLLIVNDILERLEARRALTNSMHELKEKELAKTRFLAAAGHDLRQPLAAAGLFLDALKLTEQTSRQREIIQRLDVSMENFRGLLEALLNVSKLDAGMIKPEHTSIDVTEIFNWLEQTFASMAAEKQIGFRLWFPLKSSLVICSDPGLIKSVLLNLVSNAIKFTSAGAILVSARRHGDSVLFQVWDTGIGIAEEHREHIFDEFYQIGNTQRDRTKGLGLGLSIVKRTLALLDSRIECRSRYGHGSMFGFSLPLEKCPERLRPAALAPQEAEVADESFACGKSFIVVEDDIHVGFAMVNWLESMGGRVIHFHSPIDALRHDGIERADFYISDYMLGDEMNGVQFLNAVQEKRGESICAILATGDTSAEFIRSAANCPWPVHHKPINTALLISDMKEQAHALSS